MTLFYLFLVSCAADESVCKILQEDLTGQYQLADRYYGGNCGPTGPMLTNFDHGEPLESGLGCMSTYNEWYGKECVNDMSMYCEGVDFLGPFEMTLQWSLFPEPDSAEKMDVWLDAWMSFADGALVCESDYIYKAAKVEEQ